MIESDRLPPLSSRLIPTKHPPARQNLQLHTADTSPAVPPPEAKPSPSPVLELPPTSPPMLPAVFAPAPLLATALQPERLYR